MRSYFLKDWRGVTKLLLLLVPIALMAYDILSDDLSGPRYIIPLPGGYILNTASNSFMLPSELSIYGSFQVITPPEGWESDSDPLPLSFFYRGSTDSPDCVRNVEQIAVLSCIVYGKTRSKYFLLGTIDRKLVFFNSEAELSAALPTNTMLLNGLKSPSDLALGLNKRIKHPWAFVTMNGLFGLSDEAWSGITIDTGLLVAIATGLFIPRGKSPQRILLGKMGLLVFGLMLGFITACVAYGSLLGSGPECLVGILLLTPGFGITAVLSREIPAFLECMRRLTFHGKPSTC